MATEATPTVKPDRNAAPRWPWLVLGLAVLWSAGLRVPLIVNAAAHLDSDLAVDGLTLVDALRGHWRWHYPGTPYIGILPIFLSIPQATVLGPTPGALVSGGLVASLLLLASCYLLARTLAGRGAALGSLVPLVFASTGTLWLSGRITGGHLMAAVWHAAAFGIFAYLQRKATSPGIAAFGLWCGLGLYVDSMFVTTLLGLAVALHWSPRTGWTISRTGLYAAMFLLGLSLGLAPRWVGQRVDPYSSYEDQFQTVSDPGVLRSHAELMTLECLPRLLWGHKLPGLDADPSPVSLTSPGPSVRETGRAAGPLAAIVTGLGLVAATVVTGVLVVYLFRTSDRAGRAVVVGLLATTAATLAGFILNRNIFNSDNYRYLVGLLVPWSLGWGLLLGGLWRRGSGGRATAGLLAAAWMVAMTIDAAGWYARFGWVDARGWPVIARNDDPLRSWLDAHPEVVWIQGGYWDVYRLVYLTGGRVRGVPFPVYPNRFPAWAPPEPGRRILIVRASPEGREFAQRARQAGGQVVARVGGATLIAAP